MPGMDYPCLPFGKHKEALVADHLTVTLHTAEHTWFTMAGHIYTAAVTKCYLYPLLVKLAGFALNGHIYTGFVMEGQNTSLDHNTWFVMDGHIIGYTGFVIRVTYTLNWPWEAIIFSHSSEC